MIERCQTVKNKKRKWLKLFVISGYLIYFSIMDISYAKENSKTTVGFYEVNEKEPDKTSLLPQTGEDPTNNVFLISGISILLFITGMISYRILKNEERI